MTRLATSSDGAETTATEMKIGVAGCAGRVGSLIVQDIQARHWGPNVMLAGGTVKPGYPKDADFYVTEDPEELFRRADCVIDFTNPDSTARHIWLAAKHHKPLVIGTTGLTAAHEKEIRDAAKEAPVILAANMSVGVTLLSALVEQAAARLGPEWDIEILETHHRHKIDAPSGTALALGRAAESGRQKVCEGESLTDRTGKRPPASIGFAVRRGGDVVGEHTVSFFGEGERIELSHTATNRALFAKGAIRAALWLKDKPYGLYSMRDVLGL